MEITVWVWYWHYFSLCATEAAYLLPNANESSDAESREGWEKGAEICTHIWLGKSNNAPTIQSNPIQSSPIQSGRQKKAETPPILSGFLTRLFFVLGKGFLRFVYGYRRGRGNYGECLGLVLALWPRVINTLLNRFLLLARHLFFGNDRKMKD